MRLNLGENLRSREGPGEATRGLRTVAPAERPQWRRGRRCLSRTPLAPLRLSRTPLAPPGLSRTPPRAPPGLASSGLLSPGLYRNHVSAGLIPAGLDPGYSAELPAFVGAFFSAFARRAGEEAVVTSVVAGVVTAVVVATAIVTALKGVEPVHCVTAGCRGALGSRDASPTLGRVRGRVRWPRPPDPISVTAVAAAQRQNECTRERQSSNGSRHTHHQVRHADCRFAVPGVPVICVPAYLRVPVICVTATESRTAGRSKPCAACLPPVANSPVSAPRS
mmetsp:Transcript_30123/g.70393  ORF Transcript_30123/g.70393 Transcript_30123/m.70393 type:complete len:278 (+) Transcript_30123:701-1534(+)